jgi:hypothetical protein
MGNKVQPQKVFNWVIALDGIDSFECQTLTLPSPEIEATEHGGGGRIVKTAGMVNVGDLVFSKLKPINKADSRAWTWFNQAMSSTTGNGEAPQLYEKDVSVRLLKADNVSTTYRYDMEGVWVKKIEYSELSKTSSDNVLETVTCSVDGMNQVQVPQA